MRGRPAPRRSCTARLCWRTPASSGRGWKRGCCSPMRSGSPRRRCCGTSGRRSTRPSTSALLARRAAREPLALILGRREFWSLDFAVSPATLIPRADTETLIEAALALFPDRGSVRSILDLGTGTGCLLLAALTEFPAAFGVGVDHGARGGARWRRATRDARAGRTGRRSCVGDWAASLGGPVRSDSVQPPLHRGRRDPHLDARGSRSTSRRTRARRRAGRARRLSPDHSRLADQLSSDGSGGAGTRARGRRHSWPDWRGTRGSPARRGRTSRAFPGRWSCARLASEKTVWHGGDRGVSFRSAGTVASRPIPGALADSVDLSSSGHDRGIGRSPAPTSMDEPSVETPRGAHAPRPSAVGLQQESSDGNE